jgi:hypothetical protein
MKNSFNLDLKSRPGIKYSAVSLNLNIPNKNFLIARYGNDGLKLINKIYEIFHSTCNNFNGEIVNIDLILWKEDRDKVMKEWLQYIIDTGMFHFLFI